MSEPNSSRRWWLLLLVVAIAVGIYLSRRWLDVPYLIAQEAALREFHHRHPAWTLAIAFGVYVTVAATSIPFATLLSFLLGWLFGFWPALALISFAASTGAWISFSFSRWLLRDWLEARWGTRLQSFRESWEQDGIYYLLSLRLLPMVPFWLVNLTMGLTTIRAWTFWWGSLVGMLPGTCLNVFIGWRLPGLRALEQPLSVLRWDLLLAFAALGLFPWVVRRWMRPRKPDA